MRRGGRASHRKFSDKRALYTFKCFRQLFLLETERETVDLYYNWIKKMGMHDFIEEIIYPDYNIEGLRISETKTRSPYLKVDRISWDNLNFVLKKVS